MIKTLAIIAGIFAAIAGLDVVPFLSPDLGVVIIGFSGAILGLLMKVGDYLDDNKMNDSFKVVDIPLVKSIVDIFKK